MLNIRPAPIVTSIGARYRSVAFIDLDNSYPSGGYPIVPAQLGLVSIEQLNATANLSGYVFDYDTVAQTLQVFVGTAPFTQVAGGVDLSVATNVQIVAIGQ